MFSGINYQRLLCVLFFLPCRKKKRYQKKKVKRWSFGATPGTCFAKRQKLASLRTVCRSSRKTGTLRFTPLRLGAAMRRWTGRPRLYFVYIMLCPTPHGSPALTGGREAEGSFQPLKRADCLSEASFCPLGWKLTGVARRAQPGSFLFGIFFFRTSERKSAHKFPFRRVVTHSKKHLFVTSESDSYLRHLMAFSVWNARILWKMPQNALFFGIICNFAIRTNDKQ